MRPSETIEPMWQNANPPGGRVVRLFGRLARGVARRAAPHLYSWARGREPAVTLSWGSRELRLAREGLDQRRRTGEGWQDNPRANFNEGWRRSQALAEARARTDEVRRERDELQVELDELKEQLEPKLDLSPETLAAEVQKTMGIEVGADVAEVPKDADGLKARLSAMRATLQGLDDVADWNLMEAVDDELYQLHKAVEYKLKNHRASEAKAKLDTLFKS